MNKITRCVLEGLVLFAAFPFFFIVRTGKIYAMYLLLGYVEVDDFGFNESLL